MQLPRKQYGAIPYLGHSEEAELVLITSRTNRNWIFPKGDRVYKSSKRETALLEAFEEGGLVGRLDSGKAIKITIIKLGIEIDLALYPMRVDKILKNWPEGHQRERIIVPYNKAKTMVICPKIKRLFENMV